MGRLFILLWLCMAMGFTALAQQKYFVYIESDAKEPFYVLVNGKTNYSSSFNGFLTLAQLTNGSFDAEIGFVGNKYPEQHFTITVDGQDQGFLLKQVKDNAFGLLNLQTYSTLTSSTLGGGIQQNSIAEAKPVTKQKEAPKKGFPSVEGKITNASEECVIATNADFLTLRKQMAAAATEADMITLAQLAFLKNCFSAEQVKNLALLLLDEQNKLSFFKAAKKSIYDTEHYGSLEGQLTSPNIIQQFRKTL